MVHVFTSTRTSGTAATPATKENIKNIGPFRSGMMLVFQSFQPIAIVLLSLLLVAQDLIGSADLLEPLVLAALVGMVFQGELTVSLFDFLSSCTLLNLFML